MWRRVPGARRHHTDAAGAAGVATLVMTRDRQPEEAPVDVGPAELLIVLFVVLLVFGSKKLPELARGLGQAAHEFRRAQQTHDHPQTHDT